MNNKSTLRPIFLSFLLVFLFCLTSVQASVLDTPISIEAKNENIISVLKRIETKANVKFIYLSGIFDRTKNITVSYSNTPLLDILENIFADEEILLYVINNKIIFYKENTPIPQNGGVVYTLSSAAPDIEDKKEIVKEEDIPQKDSSVETDVDAGSTIQDHTNLTIIKQDSVIEKKTDTIIPVQPIVEVKSEEQDTSTISPIISTTTAIVQKTPPSTIFISPYFSFSFLNAEATDILHDLPTQSTETGINAGFKRGAFGYQIGIGIQSLRVGNNIEAGKITVDSSVVVGYNETSAWIANEDVKPQQPDDNRYQDSILVTTRTPIYKTDTIGDNYDTVNLVKYLLIPFYLSYTYKVNESFSISMYAGIKLYLLTKASGYYYNDDLDAVRPVTDIFNDYYTSFNTGLSLSYFLKETHAVSLKTMYGTSMKSLTKESYMDLKKQEITISLSYSYFF